MQEGPRPWAVGEQLGLMVCQACPQLLPRGGLGCREMDGTGWGGASGSSGRLPLSRPFFPEATWDSLRDLRALAAPLSEVRRLWAGKAIMAARPPAG